MGGGGIGGGGGLTAATFLELIYLEKRAGHSENYDNNSITKFCLFNREKFIELYCSKN